MALTIKPIIPFARGGPLRGQKTRAFVFTADASKPTGGYTILATDLGLTYLDFGICGAPIAGNFGLEARLLIGTASTDATLQYGALSATSTNAGTDIGTGYSASVTNITTNPIPCFVIGR